MMAMARMRICANTVDITNCSTASVPPSTTPATTRPRSEPLPPMITTRNELTKNSKPN